MSNICIVVSRARETIGEEPATLPQSGSVEPTSKPQQPSGPEDTENNSSDKPRHQQQHPKKRTRYKNLNEISGAGEKGQRTVDGKRRPVGGPSGLHHDSEFIEQPGQHRRRKLLSVDHKTSSENS